MKTQIQKTYFAFALAIMSGFNLIAQETKKVDKDINAKGAGDSASNIFSQPWVWVVAAAIFILLLVALMRGNKSNS